MQIQPQAMASGRRGAAATVDWLKDRRRRTAVRLGSYQGSRALGAVGRLLQRGHRTSGQRRIRHSSGCQRPRQGRLPRSTARRQCFAAHATGQPPPPLLHRTKRGAAQRPLPRLDRFGRRLRRSTPPLGSSCGPAPPAAQTHITSTLGVPELRKRYWNATIRMHKSGFTASR